MIAPTTILCIVINLFTVLYYVKICNCSIKCYLKFSALFYYSRLQNNLSICNLYTFIP